MVSIKRSIHVRVVERQTRFSSVSFGRTLFHCFLVLLETDCGRDRFCLDCQVYWVFSGIDIVSHLNLVLVGRVDVEPENDDMLWISNNNNINSTFLLTHCNMCLDYKCD